MSLASKKSTLPGNMAKPPPGLNTLLFGGGEHMVMLLDCSWNKQVNNLFNPNIDEIENEEDMFPGCTNEAKIVHNNHAAMIV